MNQIFISYSHKDKEYAHKLHQYLIERDFHAWIDDKIDYGSRWQKQVENHLRECTVFILIMSPNSENSEWVQNELHLAKQLNKIVYTFLLEGDRWWNVQSIQYVDVRNGEMPAEKFILSLAKIISESESENSKNVTIHVGGNVQGNIIVGDKNKIDSSVNKEESIVAKQKKEKPKPFTRILIPASLNPQKKSESKPAKQNYNFRRLGIGGIILIGIVGILFAGNYFLKNLPVNETPMTVLTPTYLLNVGSTMVSGKDNMVLVFVPAGEFSMGRENDSGSNERPIHKVILDAFWIDKTEVTNDQYKICVNEGLCKLPFSTNSSTRSKGYYDVPEFDNYPVIYVNWNQAKIYCEWAGRRLPTEAEWEKAARGTTENIYPWGNESPNNNLLNYGADIGDTTAVNSYLDGASVYGALDMAGNVWEWVSDWYGENYYQTSPLSNPQGPESGEYRVVRGGSWLFDESAIPSAVRRSFVPTNFDNDIGFRCAMDAEQ